MAKWLTDFMSDDPFSKGIVFLGLGIMWLLYKIYTKQSFNMHKYSVFEWKAFVSSWAVIIMLMIFGIILIIRSF